MPNLPWLKLAKIGLPVLLVLGILWYSYSLGLNAGKAAVEADWNKEKLAAAKVTKELKEKIRANEESYERRKQFLEDKLASSEIDHARDVAALHAGFSERMRQSADRTTVYQHLSQAGESERSQLAGYAAGLDRALEQGRLLVGELRATVVQRDEQLRSLGQQLVDTRELMNTAGTPQE